MLYDGAMSISHLPPKDIRHLTSVLQFIPGEDALTHGSRVAKLTSSLPQSLRRRGKISAFFSSSPSSRSSLQSSAHRLCAFHKPLNQSQVHKLFVLLALEVGPHLNSLVAHNDWLSTVQWEIVCQLRDLHTLWLPTEVYQMISLQEGKGHMLGDGCEACILARVGGDLKVLRALRIVLLSRTRTSCRHKDGGTGCRPRLLEFVDGWIDAFWQGHTKTRYAFLEESEEEINKLKEVRKKIWRERRLGLKATGNGKLPASEQRRRVSDVAEVPDLETAGAIEELESRSDLENEIIDDYAAMLSTTDLASPISQYSSEATAVQPEAPIVHDKLNSTYLLFKTTLGAAAESHYSLDTIANNNRVISGKPRGFSADQLARNYQALLDKIGGDGLNPPVDDRSPRKDRKIDGEEEGCSPTASMPASISELSVWEAF